MHAAYTADELREMRVEMRLIARRRKGASAAYLPASLPPPPLPLNLTVRQFAVILLLLDGLSYNDISARCNIGLRAIEALMHRARKLTGARTNIQLAGMFVRAAQHKADAAGAVAVAEAATAAKEPS